MILMYHHLAQESGFCTVSLGNFRAQLAWLSTCRTPVKYDTYISLLKSGKLTPDTITVTFDDGFESFAEYALPELEQHGIHAINFVPAGHTGGVNVWDRDEALAPIRVMNEDRLHGISAHPLVTIGSHGMSHTSFGSLNEAEAREEIYGSKKKLEQITGKQVHHFSFPYGGLFDYKDTTINLVKKAGYQSACTARYRAKNRASDIFSLFRIEIEPGDTLERFEKKLEGKMHAKVVRRKLKETLGSLGVVQKHKKHYGHDHDS